MYTVKISIARRMWRVQGKEAPTKSQEVDKRKSSAHSSLLVTVVVVDLLQSRLDNSKCHGRLTEICFNVEDV